MANAPKVEPSIFADYWNKSDHYEEVADHFGYTHKSAVQKAKRLRQGGYDLKPLTWREKDNATYRRSKKRTTKATKSPVVFTDCDAQYAAAIFDLIGQVHVATKPPIAAKVTLATTKKAVIDEVMRVFPGGNLRTSEGGDFGVASYTALWEGDQNLLSLLAAVEPYLRVRKEDFQVLKQWVEQVVYLRASEDELVRRFHKDN